MTSPQIYRLERGGRPTKISGPQVISELREKLQFNVGRHLYGVVGTYAQLGEFEQAHLTHARDPHGERFPQPVNVNRELLARISDDVLRELVRDEARRPQAVQRRLAQELSGLIKELLQSTDFLILKQLELTFAYDLDLSVFRTQATNENHILLLLPGERRGEHVALFHKADPRFHRSIPPNLIADNHLWELRDG